MESSAEIRRLHRSEKIPIKEIARKLGIARNTVRAALVSERLPKYERSSRGSLVDAVELDVRKLLAEYPRMPATVIAERIGWQYSDTTLNVQIPLGHGQLLVLPVLVMTLGFSRFLTATMDSSRQAGDILAGIWQLINGLGMVPQTLV